MHCAAIVAHYLQHAHACLPNLPHATLQPMAFEWDPNKAAQNVFKHQVTFEEAATVFNERRFYTKDTTP